MELQVKTKEVTELKRKLEEELRKQEVVNGVAMKKVMNVATVVASPAMETRKSGALSSTLPKRSPVMNPFSSNAFEPKHTAAESAMEKASNTATMVAVNGEVSEDWSRLSLSTLKKKKVKDLIIYLEAKVRRSPAEILTFLSPGLTELSYL
jgi:hypothetical protein